MNIAITEEINVVVYWATKHSFSFFYKEVEYKFNNNVVDFPIYRGYPVDRLYQGEHIVFVTGSATDPKMVGTVEIPALRDFLNHVTQMELLIDRSLSVEEADALYALFLDLKTLFGALGSARNSQVSGIYRSVSDRCKRTLGITSSVLSQLMGTHFNEIGSLNAYQKAERHLRIMDKTHGRTLLWRTDLDMLKFILEHRPESLAGGLEEKYRAMLQTLDERIVAITGYEFEKSVQVQKIPFPDEVLRKGQTRVGICDSWNVSGGYGRISWIEDGRTVRCKAGQAMIFFPAGRFVERRQLYPQERIQITVMSRQELADRHYAGNLDGGDPNELRTEITIIGASEYFLVNQQIQKFVDTDRLNPEQEEALVTLMERAKLLHAAMLPQRTKALKVKNWHTGLQKAATRKLGLNKPIRQCLKLTADAAYIDLWHRVKPYQGKKSQHLNYGKRAELRHLRRLAREKLATQQLAKPDRQNMEEMIRLIDGWLAPFES